MRAADDTADVAMLLTNAIFAALPPADLARIGDDVQLVAVGRGFVTNQVEREIRNVDFPLDAMISIMATFASGTSCEVAFVGNEGFVEADAALRSRVSLRTTICQIPGTVARMRADRFRHWLDQSPAFDDLIRRSLRARLSITEQIAACNLRHTVIERLARWLLTTSAQIERDRVSLTQETFAVMLGVRRAGVSEAASALARLGAINVERAAMAIVDRAALRAAGCECYDAIAAVMQRTYEASDVSAT